MTEQEWLAFDNPDAIPDFLRGRASRRKLLLLTCAQERNMQRITPDSRFRHAVDVTEGYADGLATDQDRQAVIERLNAVMGEALHELDFEKGADVRWFVELVASCRDTARRVSSWNCDPAELPVQYHEVHQDGFHRLLSSTSNGPPTVLYEIFGNPFRPVTIDPAWLTATVVSLATAIYVERAFDRMPILADALEDAGCDNADILNHCRQPGEHVRGCWLLDILLAKE